MSRRNTLQSLARPAVAVAIVSATVAPLPGAPASLNGEWRFQLDPRNTGKKDEWYRPDFDDSKWDNVQVPSAWPRDYDGVAWYRRTVEIDLASSPSENLGLVFHQIDDQSEVYINGQLAKLHNSYNTPFAVRLNRFLKPLTDADTARLQITVRVNDLGMEGGILGDVVLKAVDDEAELYRTPYYEKTAPTTTQELGGLVMYSVYVRNFSPEGTFDALRQRLPELKHLGVDVLWLLPIHEIGEKARKGPDGSPYAIKDFYSIEPGLGTREDFRELVDAVHAHGMKIIIDCVLNHTSPDSKLAHEHPEFFVRDEKGNPRARVAEWYDIVDLDWSKKEVWNYCFEFLEHWVREYDIDGYRADVADFMPGEFWSKLRIRLEGIKPGGILMLAESEQPQKHLEGFDLTYNQRLRDAAVAVLKGGAPADTLKSAIYSSIYGYPKGATLILFVENHDKERAINEFGGAAQTRLGAVLTATLPGVPMLYTGTEVGEDADRDDTFFSVTPVEFHEDEHGMRAFWATLLALRAKHPALQTGSLTVLEAQPEDHVLAYERRTLSDRVLVILNVSGKRQVIEMKYDLLPGRSLTLGPYQWTVYAE